MDLVDVEVELYTDDASYFYNPNFYYDEGSNGTKQSAGNKVWLGDIGTGQTITKEFSLRTIKNIPPGLYKIPIKYFASYVSKGLVTTEINEEYYHEEIITARSEKNQGSKPFLIVYVLEGDDANDLLEPDLSIRTDKYLECGMRNVPFTVELSNLENYMISKANAKLPVGGSSPFRELNDVEGSPGWVYSQETDFSLGGINEPYSSNECSLHFYVDVANDAEIGIHTIPVTIICVDLYDNERSVVLNIEVNIYPIPPKLVISDIETKNILPNSVFQLTAKIENIGGSDAKEVVIIQWPI